MKMKTQLLLNSNLSILNEQLYHGYALLLKNSCLQNRFYYYSYFYEILLLSMNLNAILSMQSFKNAKLAAIYFYLPFKLFPDNYGRIRVVKMTYDYANKFKQILLISSL